LADELAALDGVDVPAMAAWVRQRGFIGVERSLGLSRMAEVETVERATEAIAHLAACRRLLGALLTELPDGGEVRDLARAASGHLVSARHLADVAGLDSAAEDTRSSGSADIQGLGALSSALTLPLTWYSRLVPRVGANDRDMWLEAQLVGTSPLGVGYVETLEAATRLKLSHKYTTVDRVNWHSPRPCERCGRLYVPQQINQRWCNTRCYWAGSKAEQRRRR
jgi:hypothetical protein